MHKFQWRKLWGTLGAAIAMAIGALVGLAGTAASSFASSPTPYSYPFEVQSQGGNVVAVNRGAATIAAIISASAANAAPSSTGPKIAITVPPYSTKRIAPLTGSEAGQYWVASTFTIGSLDAPGNTDYSYSLPYAVGETHRVSQASDNPVFSHQGDEHDAVDFDMPVGTPVHAARSGIVVYTEDQFQEGGVTPDMRYKANAVYVEHEDGTIAVYAHLKYKGVSVAVGQPVRAGDLIGYSGNTGFSSGPHLHFEVSRIVEKDGGLAAQSIPVQFQTGAAAEQATEARTDLAMTSVAPSWQVETPITRTATAPQTQPEDPRAALLAQVPGSPAAGDRGRIASDAVTTRAMGSSPALPTSDGRSASALPQKRATFALDKGAMTIAAFALFWVLLGKWNERRVAQA